MRLQVRDELIEEANARHVDVRGGGRLRLDELVGSDGAVLAGGECGDECAEMLVRKIKIETFFFLHELNGECARLESVAYLFAWQHISDSFSC